MALINKQTPPVLSPDQAWRQIKALISGIYDTLTRSHTHVYNFLWEQPDPMAVLIAAGTDAKLLWEISSAIQGLLKTVDSDYVFLNPPATPEFNEDGSVKIN